MAGKFIGTILAALTLTACQSSQEAAKLVQSEWIGQRADAFFVANGPPRDSFLRDGGGTIYTWRGGDATITRPGQLRARQTVSPTYDGRPARGAIVSYQPPQQLNYFCEMQIATNDQDVIESIRISRDTAGTGFSFSRCGEVFAR